MERTTDDCIQLETLTRRCDRLTVESTAAEVRMGHVIQSVKISADKTATVSMLVDTGATFSVIPKEMARAGGAVHDPRRRRG